MDLQKKYPILGLIVLTFCELSATMGLCRFARMFPNQEKTKCSKDDTSKEDKAVTCNRNDLPDVLDGFFDCPGSTDVLIGDVCNLTCSSGLYPTFTNQTVCEPGVTGNRTGKWSEGNFVCQDCSDLLDGRIYRFVLDEMSLSNATENCQSLNSSLVFIESEKEDKFVHELVLKCAPDKGEWKGWTWMRNNVSDSGYDNWDINEPNAAVNNPLCAKEECVGMKYDSGKWFDQCCNRAFYSVCEQNE